MPHAPSYNDPTMILIDAYSQIFRGYYAVSGLTSSRGEPTNAVFAIAKLLLKMHREYPGSSGAAVFDCGKVAYRMELNPAYKANRKPTPPELLAQLPAIRELFAAFGWPLLEKEQYEADDLIAALAVANTAHPVKIVSSDKDLSQIICDRITQLVPDRKSGFQ